MEERLIELETRLSFQEETLEQLNQCLSTQQQAILKLKETLEVVTQRLKEHQAALSTSEMEEPPPPHY